HQKRVVDLAPVAAAVTLHRTDHVARRTPAERDEGWQVARTAVAGQDAAEVRRHAAAGRREEAGEPERAGFEMAAVEVAVGADAAEAVAGGGEARQQLAEADAGRAGGDGGERPTVFGGGVRFRVAGIEVAGRPPEPDEKHRPGPGGFTRRGAACQD